MPVNIPVHATQLEQSIIDQVRSAGRKIGKKGGINLGTSAKSIEALSQPLGRITGKADQFTKSMEAANARVLAFGASVGVLSAVTRGFKELVATTIEVEKSLASINAIMGASSNELERFKKTIFDVARNTEQSFDTVANAALEFSRQGLKAQQVVERLNDSMILARLSGLGAGEAVAGLTAAINSFNSTGIKSSEVLNKLSAAAAAAAVSERDLIEGIKRSGAVAIQAGVTFDELVGVISSVQEKTARGGAVIGNSFKTIFTRLQSLEKLTTMRDLGVDVTDASGAVLSATKLIDNLAKTLRTLPSAERLQIAENLVGKFQVAPFLAILEDMSKETSRYADVTRVAGQATNEAYTRNIALNKTLAAAINEAGVNLKELANTLGEIGVTESLKNVLGFFNSLVTGIRNLLEGEGIGSDFARGIVKGIGNIISGPGLAIFGAIIAKLTFDLVKFGTASLKTFFGIGGAAKQIAQTQGQIAATLLNNKAVQDQILKIENSTLTVEQKRVAQTEFFTAALNKQLATMQKMQAIAARVAPGVVRGTTGGRKAAGGFIPNFDAVRGYGSEQAAINRGVGGAPPSARPVTIPNFAFGGGKRGTITANTSEFIVPNFAGGGSAIFNQDMVKSMGLPSGARKIGAAGGYIPNFVNENQALVLFTGNRGGDRTQVLTAGQVGGKTNAWAGLPPKGVKGAQPVTVPIYKLGPRGGNPKEPSEIQRIKNKLSKTGSQAAKAFARELSGRKDLPTLTHQQIEGLFNPGAFEGFAGSVFEVSLSSLLGSGPFKDYAARTATSRIDLPHSHGLFKKFGVPHGLGKLGAEVKATDNTELVKGAAIKFYDILHRGKAAATYTKGAKSGPGMAMTNPNLIIGQDGKPMDPKTYQALQRKYLGGTGKGGIPSGAINLDRRLRAARGDRSFKHADDKLGSFKAGGYIPNYAGVGPLAAAIERESQAGLPINQIRINQSSRLRNAGNPMGLAVTNTRDEPTGAVPNFAKPTDMSSASGDLMMKFMGLTMAASMLTGMFSEMGDKASKFGTGLTDAMQAIMMIAMMRMAFPGKEGPGPMMMGFTGGKSGKELGRTAGTRASIGHRLGRGVAKVGAMGGGAVGKVGSGIAGLGKGLFRLIPFVGQLVFGFQALNAITKMFGLDMGKAIGEFLGLIDTPAEKTAKALAKIAEEGNKALASGAFGKTTGGFTQFLQQQVTKTMATEADIEAAEDDPAKLKERVMSRSVSEASFRKDISFLTQKAVQRQLVWKDLTQAEIIALSPKEKETATGKRLETPEERFAETQATLLRQLEKRGALAEPTDKGDIAQISGFKPEGEFGVRPIGLSQVQRRTLNEMNRQLSLLGGARDPQSRDALEMALKTGNQKGAVTALRGLMTAGEEAVGTERVAEIRELIGSAGDMTDADRVARILKIWKEITNEVTLAEEITVSTAKIQEALAKARLANMTEIQLLEAKMESSRESELKVERDLLSTTAARKAEIDVMLSNAAQQKTLIQEQVKATSKLLQAEGAIKTILKSRSPTKDIEKEAYEDIKKIIGETNDLIIEEKGFTQEVEDSLRKKLILNDRTKKIAEDVVNLVKEENSQISKRLAFQRLEEATAKFNEALKKSQLKTEQSMVSALERRLSIELDLAKNASKRLEIDRQISALEDQKVGKGPISQLSLDEKILEKKKQQARLDNEAERARIFGGLRTSIFDKAKGAGLTPDQLSGIQGDLSEAQTVEAFKPIVKSIEAASKEAEIAALKIRAEEQIAALQNLGVVKEGADFMYDSLVEAGRVAGNALIQGANFLMKAIGKKGEFKLIGEPAIKEVFGGFGMPGGHATPTDISGGGGIQGFRGGKGATISERIAAVMSGFSEKVAGIRGRDEGSFDEMLQKAGINVADLPKQLQLALDQLQRDFDNAAKSTDDFASAIERFMKTLDQQAIDLQMGLFLEQDAAGMFTNLSKQRGVAAMKGARDRGLTGRAFQGARADILDEELLRSMKRDARLAKTHAEASSIMRERDIIKEILAIRKEMTKEGANLVELEEKLIAKEKERLAINDSLGAMFEKEFVKKDSEISRQFNEKFVGAARAFTTELTHGMVDAIVKGESLKDVLLSAATGFLTTMSKAFMDKAVDNLVSGITGSIGGAATGAKGGAVRGGSGMKDDVPALLMGGEFVMRKKAVNKYGADFMKALNAGSVPKMADGGFFIPGTRGQGAISGKRDLLSFATQSYTGGRTDRISSGRDFVSAFLEPESPRLTQWGRRNNATWKRVQDSKREAFDLYVQQLGQDEEKKRRAAELAAQKKAQKEQLWRSLGMAALSGGIAYGTGKWAQSRNAGALQVGSGAGAGPSPSNVGAGGYHGSWEALGVRSYMAAAGGAVPYAAGVDTIPSMLSGGEFVMNAAATQRLGAGNLETLNAGGALGGDNGEVLKKLDNIAEVSGGETKINITVNSNGTTEEDAQGGGEGQKRGEVLGGKIRDAVREIITQEKRLGGILRQ